MKVNIGTSDTAFKQMDIRKKTKTQKACYTNIRIGKHTICMDNFFSRDAWLGVIPYIGHQGAISAHSKIQHPKAALYQ